MPAKVDKEKCNGCARRLADESEVFFRVSCVEECPSEAINMAGDKAKVDPDTCIDCGVCVDACPEEAISME